ncbi:MAG: hypothetical protein H0X17_08945, partial [Deltaproteobacteria bacterium]|nr:hypothetical protein [Deltaproteobacteria bacterium]
ASPPPLATIRDDQQLAATLAVITNDPAIVVDDPATRAVAQALMIEGVKQLAAKSFDQALANFLEAYAKFPSPKILLTIATTLRDMGRLADAANTYQRYLLDPATGAERVAEVKEVLLRLDEQLTILTVRVMPHGSDVSIDGGPYVPVGSSLLTRVRPGLHLVRVRKAGDSSEVTVNGFEGEHKEVAAVVKVGRAPAPPVTAPAAAAPEHVEAWLTTGTQYGSDGSGRVRKVRSGFAGPEVAPVIPVYRIIDEDDVVVAAPSRGGISSGVLGVMRIDGELRGAAGGIGLALAQGRFEVDLLVLRSDVNGGYVGARYRLLTGFFRPYVALGMPGFMYEQMSDTDEISTKLAVGIRAAGGVELVINGHLSVQADLGYEHFFGDLADAGFETDLFVPTVGVIGRL